MGFENYKTHIQDYYHSQTLSHLAPLQQPCETGCFYLFYGEEQAERS